MPTLILLLLIFVSCSHNKKPLAHDPFLWLENITETKSLNWVEKRNQETFSRLKEDSRFEKAKNELLKIYEDPEKIPYIRMLGNYAYNIWRDEKNTQGLLRRTTLQEYKKEKIKWETVIDFDLLSRKEGKTLVYKGMQCLAPKYIICMIKISNGGGDAVEAREFDTAKKKFVKENAFFLPESKHHLTWIDKDHLYIGLDLGENSLTTSGYPRTARLWSRGTPIKSSRVIFAGKKEDVSVLTWRSDNPQHKFTLFIRELDFFNQDVFILFDGEKKLRQLNIPTHIVIENVFKDYLILKNRKNWSADPSSGMTKEIPSGSLLSLKISALSSNHLKDALKIIWSPSERSSLENVAVTKSFILLNISQNVKSEAYRTKLKEGQWWMEKLALPKNGTLSFSATRYNSNEFIYYYENFLTPETSFLFNIKNLKQEKLKNKKSYFDSSHMTVEQLHAKSRDGTLIPYFIVRQKYMPYNEKNPTYLYGYGGFSNSMGAYYSPTLGTQWLAKGGTYVLANIRGGGEFGPKWHQAAMKEKRQNSYDDFHAVAEDLIRRKITSPRHLAIAGASNGGLLVAVAFTQRPELYHAVACSVPLLDMLRYHKLLAGASWMAEYGNPDIPSQRKYILQYSPYQNVFPATSYPEVYFFTSTKDDRVHPGHARKMVARMQQQGHSVLYYENTEGGHGGAANLKQSAIQQAMKYVFFWQKIIDKQP